jgi:hypothetical protein
MVFVPINDAAWDFERADREAEALREAWEADRERRKEGGEELRDEAWDPAEHHPFWAYFSGRTRYHIDDPELQPYLDRSKSPERWTIRRLSFDERQRAQAHLREGRLEEAYWLAFFAGVEALDGVSDEAGEHLAKTIAGLPALRTAKHIATLKEAIAGYAMGVVADVGSAVVQASLDLTAIEGKPFASPPGD